MKRSINKKIILIVLMLCSVAAIAQTDPQIGQYMHLQTVYNPAAAGEGDLMRVAGMHRMQYTGVGAYNMPMSTYFAFSSPFEIQKTKHAVGVRFLNDKYGFFTNQTFHVQYAYRHKVGKGYLSGGLDLGFVNMSFRTDSINLDKIVAEVGEGFFSANDQAIPKGTGKEGSNGMSFDMGVGVYYSAPTWWVGVSYSHLTQPKVEWSDLASIRMTGTLYMAGGYNWRLKQNRDWVLKPSMMVMTDFVNWDVNLTMLAEVRERFRFGAGYRIGGSVNLLLGVDIVSGLQLGYTYELPANRLIKATYGSHEIFLSYGFNVLKPKRTNKYKSIRYL